jgi:prepilin-type N-terminal cleavage/methylation domain-containing protein
VGVERIPGEKGFTLIELMIVIFLIAIILAIGVLNAVQITRINALNSAKKQVEGALKRAKTMATQENVTYRIVFLAYNDINHPNTYYFEQRQADGSYILVDKSITGEEVTDGGYIRLGNRVNITQNKTIYFQPKGTILAVSGDNFIDLRIAERTGRVSIDDNGRITL